MDHLDLSTRIKLDEAAVLSPNLTDRFTEGELDQLGLYAFEGYEKDRVSRSTWEKRNEAGLDLALQLQKAKSFPWPGASNVAFPLVTIAALQFHAQAYPTLVQPPDPVHMRVIGEDETGEETKRGERISEHMSWQLLEEDESWEEQHDRGLLSTAIVGTGFKKSYFSEEQGHIVSDFVPAKDLYVDYWAKSVDSAARKTHRIPLYRNDIYERVKSGAFRAAVLEEEWYKEIPPNPQPPMPDIRADKRQGVTPGTPDHATPFFGLEQHVRLDLDGDGYGEPWILTFEEQSRKVLRLTSACESMDDIRRSDNEIESIRHRQMFTKMPFIPSPDGGFYDIGFGVLLGPMNESVNTLINQLIDCGTMQTTAGGFLGRGAKIRGGVYTFSPHEWKRVDSTGDDLRKSIFPLPVRDPSAVLYQLLGLLIQYSNRISATMEAMVGESTGQNTPAETSRAMVSQGMKVYAAIFKRLWRAMKLEFKSRYRLNGLYMPIKAVYGPGKYAMREDYKGSMRGLVPSADPHITSDAEMMFKLMNIKQSALMTPGYDIPFLEKRILRAYKMDAIDQLYPGPDKVPPLPNPKMQVEMAKTQRDVLKIQAKQQELAAQLIETRRVNSAKIVQLQAQAAKLIEEAKVIGGGHEIEAIRVAIEALVAYDQSLKGHIDQALQAGEQSDADKRGNVEGMAGPSGNAKTNGLAPPSSGGGEAGMGAGGVH